MNMGTGATRAAPMQEPNFQLSTYQFLIPYIPPGAVLMSMIFMSPALLRFT